MTECFNNRDSRWKICELFGWLASLVLCVILTGCRPAAPTSPALAPTVSSARKSQMSPVIWTDLTAESGVRFTYRNGREANVYSIVESLGGGVGMLDIDHDGHLDLFFPGGGTFGPGESISGNPAGLFRSVAAWKFEEITKPANVAAVSHYTHGCSAADYDNDGFQDLVVTGYGGLQLFHNQGDGTFQEVHLAAKLDDTQWSSSAGWADLNADGNLDLYVAHYVDWSWKKNPPCILPRTKKPDVCPPREFEGLDDVVYFSSGDGSFWNGMAHARLRPEGKGLGVLLADFDLDQDVDVYVANDTTDNYLYLNDGQGVFEESGTVRGVATDDRGAPNGSMGVAVLDYNLDSQPDIWVANFENESFALYRNEGQATFTHASQAAGIHALGSIYVGFGTASGDFDRDGDEDLMVANGHVVYYPPSGHVKQIPLLLLNEKGRFKQVEFDRNTYFGAQHHGRGLAVGDLDNDGDLDGVFANNNEPAAVVRNDTSVRGNWLGVKLIGTQSNRNAIGARAVLKTSRNEQSRQIFGGGSYLSQHDLRLFWGIPEDARVESLEIHWPSGLVQQIEIDELGRYQTVMEPSS